MERPWCLQQGRSIDEVGSSLAEGRERGRNQLGGAFKRGNNGRPGQAIHWAPAPSTAGAEYLHDLRKESNPALASECHFMHSMQSKVLGRMRLTCASLLCGQTTCQNAVKVELLAWTRGPALQNPLVSILGGAPWGQALNPFSGRPSLIQTVSWGRMTAR